MEHIIELYLNPPEHLFCFDECTGLQALERIAPTLPFAENRPNYEEFDYRRHGTTTVMAALRVKTGKVFVRCTPDHKTPTFVRYFQEHVQQQPEDAIVHYICDNYSTHYNEHFCQAVADLSGISYTPLKTGRERRQWLQSPDKRIVIHFLPYHASWLNMIEIWFGILKGKALKHESFKSLMHLEDTVYNFSYTCDEYFAHPFTWKYKGDDLYEKTLHRFNKWLIIESEQMNKKLLKKQLLLMINIIDNYWKKVKEKDWKQLLKLLNEKNNYLKKLIENDIIVYDVFQELLSCLSGKLNSNVSLLKSAA
jgi:transposase